MAVSGVDVFGSGGVTLAAFAASRLGVWSDPIDESSAVPHSPQEALAQSGAAAVLDGPMFATCDGSAYATAVCATVRFEQYDETRGEAYIGESGGEGLTIAIVGGAAVAVDGAVIPAGATVAIQTYPTLVRNGRVVATNSVGTNGTAEWRAGLAILNDGRVAFAAGALDMVGFASALLAAGATDAGYTDGGGSAALWLADGSSYGASEQRRVATWLIAGPESTLASLLPQTTSQRLLYVGIAVGLGFVGWALYDEYGRKKRVVR